MRIMWENEVVAERVKTYDVLPVIKAVDGIEQWKLPFSLFGFNEREVSWVDFCKWIETRCFPENRVDVKEELERLGLEDYIPMQIVERNHGRLASDEFWVDFEIEKEEKIGTKRYNIYLGKRKEVLGEFRETQYKNRQILEMVIYKGHCTPIDIRLALGDSSIYSGAIDDKYVREIIKGRVNNRTNANIIDILNEMGMAEYNTYEIYKHNNGMSKVDECWVDFEHEKRGY